MAMEIRRAVIAFAGHYRYSDAFLPFGVPSWFHDFWIVHVMKNTLLRQAGSLMLLTTFPMRRSVSWAVSLQTRERTRLQSEMSQIRGLMPLLMKQRNGYIWSEDDRREIRGQLCKLLALGPYLILFILPGGFIALPVLAWWLDRRRQKRIANLEQPHRK